MRRSMLNNGNVIEARSTLSTLPKAVPYDVYFTDCSVAKPTKKQPGQPTATNAVVTWNTKSTTYNKQLIIFDLDRRLISIETEAAAMHPKIRVTAPALPRQPQSNRRLRLRMEATFLQDFAYR